VVLLLMALVSQGLSWRGQPSSNFTVETESKSVKINWAPLYLILPS
jgi:hypothetical protein